MSHPEELGHSAFGANDIYSALLPFAKQIKTENRIEYAVCYVRVYFVSSLVLCLKLIICKI